MNLNKAISEAIAKGAVKAARKPIANLRRDVASLKREVAGLKRLLKGLRPSAGERPEQARAAESVPAMRPTAKMVLGLRKKLGLTQAGFGKLAGVSTLTVGKWEKASGVIRMRSPALQGLAKVKAMGKRRAKAALAGE